MRKLRGTLCLLSLLLLIPALVFTRHMLPIDTRPLVAEKYAGWSGVLNLWIYEGWPLGSGSISPWLNQCITGFERAHPGVYVQPLFVDNGAITSVNDSGIVPPDILLFPPNLLASPEGLLPLAAPENLRPALCRSGQWNGTTYAIPVALGGYLWVFNSEWISTLPDSWDDTDAVLSVPPPEPWRRWDAALLALCSERYAPADPDSTAKSTASPAGEVELGLAGGESPVPTASPEPNRNGTLCRHLPADFHYDEDAWRHFVNGESAAMPVTQREIRRLQALSDRGKGPQWQLGPGDNGFTDQLLAMAIVNRPDNADRQTLCADFISWLLTDTCQSSLYRASAFSVTGVPSGYASSDPLAILDNSLRNPSLSVPRIFDRQWVWDAEAIVRKFADNIEEAPTLWRKLRELLS